MSVYSYILKKLASEKLHMTLIDPTKQSIDSGADLALLSIEAGSDAIMIGGSTGIVTAQIDALITKIKKRITSVPIIIFPNSIAAISKYADAIYFMSMLNSQDLRYIIKNQMLGAEIIRAYNIEPISMAYLVIEPGMAVGRVGKAALIRRDDEKTAVRYALAAEYFGMKLVYLEAGSGADKPVSTKMVKAVKANIHIPLIVGGGIRTDKVAHELCSAGADIIVTGTLVEKAKDVKRALTELIQAIK